MKYNHLILLFILTIASEIMMMFKKDIYMLPYSAVAWINMAGLELFIKRHFRYLIVMITTTAYHGSVFGICYYLTSANIYKLCLIVVACLPVSGTISPCTRNI
jgi:hypothetical protein